MMDIATFVNANMGFYYKKSTKESFGSRLSDMRNKKGLTFNCESRPKQKSLEDGGGSGATNCGENRREPSSSAPEAPPGHWGPADGLQPLNERICLSDECFSTILNGCFYQYDWMKIKIYKLAYVFLFLIRWLLSRQYIPESFVMMQWNPEANFPRFTEAANLQQDEG